MAFLDWLHAQPRVSLGHFPTPIEFLPRLSDELGGPRIWVKRDDCTGLATGGNKTRKLEYLLGQAVEAGYRQVLTFGAVQSNHARQTAAACARLGLDCHLLLSRRVPWAHAAYERGGNVLLDRLCGAQITIVDLEDVEAASQSLLERLGGQEFVYVIPAGGSNARGALGYVGCAEEILAQSQELEVHFSQLFHASASAGTQAGLVAGFACLGSQTQVVGVNVFHPKAETLGKRVSKLVEDIQYQFEAGFQMVPEIAVVHDYLGDGYGLPNPAQLEAMTLAARLEGLIFDPVYSGKALHALIDRASLGRLETDSDVLLLHSGGASVWSVYEGAFSTQT